MGKNVGSLVLVAVLAAVPLLSGATRQTPTGLSGTIQFMTWTAGPSYNTAIYAIVDNFNKAHPGASVHASILPYDTWSTKITLAAATHTMPDVFQLDSWHWNLYEEGLAADLRPYLATDPFFHDPKHYYTRAWVTVPPLHNQVLALPAQESVNVLYYNRDLFAKAKVAAPTNNSTWKDFLTAAQLLTLDDKGRNATDPNFDRSHIVQFGTDTNWQNSYDYEVPLWENGGALFDRIVDPTKCTLDSPTGVKVLQWVADLPNRYHVAPTATQAAALPGAATQFATGRIAMSYDGDWNVPSYVPIKAFKWDIVQAPRGPLGRIDEVGYGAYSMSSYTKYPQLAWAFLKYMAEDKQAQRMLSASGAAIPARLDVAYSDAFLHPSWAPPHYANRLRALADAHFSDFLFSGWGEAQTRYWIPIEAKLWAGKLTAAQAAQQICAGTAKYLAKK
jgi:multiple sugar transport system substrate-binding protein